MAKDWRTYIAKQFPRSGQSSLSESSPARVTTSDLPLPAPPATPVVSRCSMCGMQRKGNHENLLYCVSDMRAKLAVLTNDPEMIPPPPTPPIPIGEGQREAYRAYARGIGKYMATQWAKI